MSTTSGARSPTSGRASELASETTISKEAGDNIVPPETSADIVAQSGRANLPSRPSSGDESPLRSALSVLTTIGPPLTIATALMFYFGWARSNRQAEAMGLGNVSLFGYSTQDYVLMSISTLFIPLLIIAALALGWLALHRRIGLMLSSPSRPKLRTAGRAAFGVGLLAAFAAVIMAMLDPEQAPLVLPLVLAGGTALAAYGGWLSRAADDSHEPLPPPPSWQRALNVVLLGSVITLALFWEVSKYADVVGLGYARRIEQRVSRLPHATAFSENPLGILAPGVHEERMDMSPDADTPALRYRTSGMRFLVRSGERVFLLHNGWTLEEGTVIVVPDSEETRWQFSH
jgi:hypothetical protein